MHPCVGAGQPSAWTLRPRAHGLTLWPPSVGRKRPVWPSSDCCVRKFHGWRWPRSEVRPGLGAEEPNFISSGGVGYGGHCWGDCGGSHYSMILARKAVESKWCLPWSLNVYLCGSGFLMLLWEIGLGLPDLFPVPVYHLKTLPSLLIKQITRSVHNFSVFFPTQTMFAI